MSKWISKELLSSALQRYFNVNVIDIVSFKISEAVPAGDSYASIISRIDIVYKNKNCNEDTLSVILKAQPRGDFGEVLTLELGFFNTEIEVYENILPSIYKVLDSEKDWFLTAKCVYTTNTPDMILIIEDLKPKGFKMLPKHMGFDLDHCIMVMQKIAKLHAASLIMLKNNPDSFKNIANGLFTNDPMSSKWITIGYKSLVNSCRMIKGFEKYVKKMEKFENVSAVKGVAAGTRNPNGFSVLNHGDMWANNMLFKYDNNDKLTDVKFIDLQLMKYTSPALDLHYFYATTPTNSVWDKLDILLNVYYSHLLATLSLLKYPLNNLPTLDEFKKDFEQRAFYGVMTLSTVTPITKSTSKDKDASLDSLTKPETNFHKHCYTNDSYLTTLKYFIPYYDSLGIFD